MPRRFAPIAVLLVAMAAAWLAFAPQRSADAGRPAAPLTVLAASSLTEVLAKVAAAWQAGGNGAVTVSFDASSRLAKQVEAGVPADVFVSADAEWMDWLDARGLTAPGSRATVAGNTLVAVVRADAATVPGSAADLAAPAVTHLALAGENVPAGRYARAALTTLGAWEAVQGRVVTGDTVRTTLAWVADGEAEAGVVYATDARVEPRVKVAFGLPASAHPPIVYPAAVLASSEHGEDARRFVAFLASAEGRALFAEAGFLPPPG